MTALILDMDGVLVNTEPLIFNSFREIFAPLQIVLPDEYLYQMVGDPTRKNMQDISRDYAVDLDVDLFTQKLDAHYAASLETASIALLDGMADLLERTKKRGVKIALCTTSEREIVNKIMQRIGISQGLTTALQNYFQCVVSGDMVTRKKPDPEPYQMACRLLQVQPETSVVIEDSSAGITAAKAAGCYCFGLRAPYNLRQDFSRADWIIEHLTDITLI
jgi:beta-phosphoglucomutase-like phosphatase (HAD superfamily)